MAYLPLSLSSLLLSPPLSSTLFPIILDADRPTDAMRKLLLPAPRQHEEVAADA